MERLDKGLLDFGLIIQPADISKYGSVILPNKDTWGIIMNRESELASKKAIKREDLRGKPLIISKQISRRESARGGLLKWLAWCGACHRDIFIFFFDRCKDLMFSFKHKIRMNLITDNKYVMF